jgi:hypothetical protein
MSRWVRSENVNIVIRVICLLAMELVYNIYPATQFSSFLLHSTHGVILLGLL